MPDLPKLYYLLNDGTQLSVYRTAEDTKMPWFIIRARECEGASAEEKAQAFREIVTFQRTAFGPLADYKELKALPAAAQAQI